MNATVRELPPIGELSQNQQRGIDCVFCGITLAAGNVIDLGPQKLRKGDWVTRWYPRCCKSHGKDRS